MAKKKYKLEEIDLIELFSLAVSKKIYFFLIIFSFSITGVVYSLSLPNIYKSDAILIPVEDNLNLSSSLSLNPLNSLQGLNMFSTRSKKSFQAVEKIKSFSFFKNNFLPNININDLHFDNKLILQNTDNEKISISPLDLYSIYTKILTISTDNNTGFIKLSIEHESPEITVLWVEIIIDEINKYFRTNDRIETELAVDYLNKKLSESSINNIKDALSRLISQELQKLAIIEANKDYVLKVLEPPYVPERKVKPSRLLISFMGALMGLVTFALFTLNIYFKEHSKDYV